MSAPGIGWDAGAAGAGLAGVAGGVVRYRDFGAVGDGRADDFEALAKAHEVANAKRLPVKADDGATYYLGGADRTIPVETDTDFGTARFIIDDTALDNPRSHVFEVRSTAKPVDLAGVKSLAKGQGRIDARLPGPCVVMVTDDSVRRFIRRGKNQNSGSLQTDVFLVDGRGRVDPRTPILWDFKQLSQAVAWPVDERSLTLRGGTFTTMAAGKESTTYHARGIAIRRSNVRVERLRHLITGEGEHGPPYQGFISIANCAHVLVEDTVLSGHKTYYKIGSAGKGVPMGSYDISITRALDVALVKVTQANDIMDRSRWGVIGTNFCKNLSYDGCSLSRFDAHQGVAGATIRNSMIGHMGVLLTGFGEFLIENSTVRSRHFIGLRADYGSTWTGNITIRDCRFVSGPGGRIFDGSNDGCHDFGYPCQMPGKITIDGLVIEDGASAKKSPVVFGDFNPDFAVASSKPPFPYGITRELNIRNVTTTSGQALCLSDNPTMFRRVRVQGSLGK